MGKLTGRDVKRKGRKEEGKKKEKEEMRKERKEEGKKKWKKRRNNLSLIFWS